MVLSAPSPAKDRFAIAAAKRALPPAGDKKGDLCDNAAAIVSIGSSTPQRLVRKTLPTPEQCAQAVSQGQIQVRHGSKTAVSTTPRYARQ